MEGRRGNFRAKCVVIREHAQDGSRRSGGTCAWAFTNGEKIESKPTNGYRSGGREGSNFVCWRFWNVGN